MTKVHTVRIISFALKHVANIFLSDCGAPKCCKAWGKLSLFSPLSMDLLLVFAAFVSLEYTISG